MRFQICSGIREPRVGLIGARVGDGCLAKYFKYWYRAEVTELLSDGFRARVRYVDYGNSEILPLDELFAPEREKECANGQVEGQPDLVMDSPRLALLFRVGVCPDLVMDSPRLALLFRVGVYCM